MQQPANSIDEYLAAVNVDKRAALEKLRALITAVAPNAEECISYGMPTFRFEGKMLVAFGAFAGHCSFFPLSAATLAAFKGELKDYSTSKGTLRFQVDHPLPDALVVRMVLARIEENRLKIKKAGKES